MIPKILFFTEIPTPYRQPVFERLARKGVWDLQILYLASRQRNRSWNLAAGSSLPGLELLSLGSYSLYLNWGVKRELMRQKPDLVVLSGYAQLAFLRAAHFCHRAKIPYVTLTESHLKKKRHPLWSRLKAPLLRAFYRNAAAHLTTGTAAKRYVESFGVPSERIFLFPNTIDVKRFSDDVDRCRNSRAPNPAPRVLYVGHLMPWKGVDLLIQAFAQAQKECPGASLHFIGDGRERANLERFAQTLSPESVRFHGFVQPSDLPRHYAEADILAVPSRHETWGVVMIEAMTAGLPVVSSDAVGATDDLIVPGQTGVLFSSGDVAECSKALLLLMKNDDMRKSMGIAAQKHVRLWGIERAEEGFSSAVTCTLGSRR